MSEYAKKGERGVGVHPTPKARDIFSLPVTHSSSAEDCFFLQNHRLPPSDNNVFSGSYTFCFSEQAPPGLVFVFEMFYCYGVCGPCWPSDQADP